MEMQIEDYELTPCGPLGSRVAVAQHDCRWLGDFPAVEDALAFVRQHMEDEQHWPSVFWISDHGNYWPIDLEGNEIK